MTIWILTAILPIIMLALWSAVLGDGEIAGFQGDDVWRYFVATLVCRQLTGAWVVWELAYGIRMGHLSPQLLRPFHPLATYAVWMLSAMPFRILILSPILVVLVTIRPELLAAPSWSQLALFVPTIALAWAMNFLVQCLFGMLSFWLDKSEGAFEVFQAFWALLSGYIAPLAFFPDAWQGVLRILPFRSMLALPVELLGGFLDPAEALPDLALQLCWTLTLAVTVAFVWRRGVRRYGAFGA